MSLTMNGACHCGAVKFRVVLTDGLEKPRRCTCSICRMRGAVAVTAQVGGLEIIEGKDALTVYRFNTGVAQHYFCGRCGIYTHHQRRSNPNELGVNVACLEGVSPFDFPEVQVNDGVLHPRDGEGGGRPVGILRFERLGPTASGSP
ncbi:MAG: Centromere protein [Caulobacteraceae bacterium]|nr:Centromere protein [Caulobacteraceae bacterium]